MDDINGILYPENGEGPHIISGPVIAKKVCDKKFEELVTEIRNANRAERIQIARSQIADITNYFQTIWDESPQDFVKALLQFLYQAVLIGCTGIQGVSEDKRAEILEFMQDIPQFQGQFIKRKEFFDYTRMSDEDYQVMVSVFLCASLEPLTSPYPVTLFAFMLCVACANQVNESGIQTIRKLRDDYIAFALRKQQGSDEEFTGRFQPMIAKGRAPVSKPAPDNAKAAKKDVQKQQADMKEAESKKIDKQINSIKQIRQQYADFVQHGNQLKQDYNASLEDAMSALKEKMRAHIAYSSKKLESELASQKNTLASLGLFSFSKKNECKAKIADLEHRLSTIKAADYFDKKIAPYQTQMESAKKNYAQAIDLHINNGFSQKEYTNHEYLKKISELRPIREIRWSTSEQQSVAEDILSSLEITPQGMTYVDLLNEQVDHASCFGRVLRRLSADGYISEMRIGTEDRYFHYSDKRFTKISLPTLISPDYPDRPWPVPIEASVILQWKED